VELRRFLALLTIALVILLIITVWFFPSNEDFRVENPFWNGTRNIGARYPAQPLESLADLPASPQGATLILIPYLNCTPAELEQLNRFVSRGGNLILADDYGYGNQVLEHLGLKARFTRQTLLDPLSNYKTRQFPKIIHLANSPLTSNSERLVFNHATSLANVATASTLALSSSFSFLDLNGNGTWQDDEPTGPLPVISHHGLGSGQVILVSDPSLFINSMEAREDNDSFMQNIASTTTSLYLDQSHLPLSELHQTKNLLTQTRGLLATPSGTLGLIILVLTVMLKPIWHEKKGDHNDYQAGNKTGNAEKHYC
jgi:hypothetical protein